MDKAIAHRIEQMIYVIRGTKVMLDRDLAALYGVPTRRLNEQVRRNPRRFPQPDFMFQLTKAEMNNWKSQFATSNREKMGMRKCPLVFSEQGVAMLSSVLNSERAIEVNVSIMKTFIRLRHLLLSNESLADRVAKLESGTDKLFRIVFERLDTLEADAPILSPNRRKLGL